MINYVCTIGNGNEHGQGHHTWTDGLRRLNNFMSMYNIYIYIL